MRFAIVTSEISPFVRGGIAPGARALAQVFAGAGHDVDLFTLGRYRDQARVLRRSRLPVLTHDRITWHWVREPDGPDDWQVRMAENFRDAVVASGVAEWADLVEIKDYLGLGALAGQALRAAPVDRRPRILTRLHSSAELVAALDHREPDEEFARIAALERISLTVADTLAAPSTSVETLYRRLYTPLELPPLAAFWPALLRDDLTTASVSAPTGGSLRLLFLARLQEFKGIVPLVEAIRVDPQLDVALTIIGSDTLTAPGGTSMRAYVESLIGNDRRIEIAPAVPREQVARLIAAHDALVMPSRWETWGTVCLETLAANRPLLVTPSASMPRMTDHGRLGLVAGGFDTDAVGAMLAEAVERRDWLRALPESGEIPRWLTTLCRDDAVVAGYEALARVERRAAVPPIAEADVATVAAELLDDDGGRGWAHRNDERVAELIRTEPEPSVSAAVDGDRS